MRTFFFWALISSMDARGLPSLTRKKLIGMLARKASARTFSCLPRPAKDSVPVNAS